MADYFTDLVLGGQTGTYDPVAAGLVPAATAAIPPMPPQPQMIPGGALSGDGLARLASPQPIEAPGGGDISRYVPLVGPDRGTPWTNGMMPAAGDLADKGGANPPQMASAPPMPLAGGVGTGNSTAQTTAPVSVPLQQSAASVPAVAPASASASNLADPYGILKPIMADIAARRNSSWSDQLLRFGLATMAAAGKPMSTFGGSVGAGGLAALDARDAQRSADLKALLSGAQVTNLLSEAGVRQSTVNARDQNAQLAAADAAGGARQSTMGKAGGSRATSSVAVNSLLPVEARALLDTIAGPESSGAYNIRYTPSGGATFSGYNDHPRIYEKGPEGPSSAAGRYQIVASTWDKYAPQVGATDFSPKNQDAVAWQIAQDAYKQQTGGDLLSALKEGKLADVRSALKTSRQWDTANLRNYRANLAKYSEDQALSGGSGSEPASSGAGGDEPGAPPKSLGSSGTRAGASLNPAYARYRAVVAHNAGDSQGATYWYGVARAPDNYTWNPDGTLSFITGGAADPAQVRRLKEAEAQAEFAGPGASPDLQGRIAGARAQAEAPVRMSEEQYKTQLGIAAERNKPVTLNPGQTYQVPNAPIPSPGGQAVQPTQPTTGSTLQGPNPATVEFAQRLGQKGAEDFQTRRTAALDAATSLESTAVARQLIDNGIFTGAGANALLALHRGLAQVGLVDGDKVANTEAFISARAQEVGRLIKQFGSGTGLSDADREYAAKMAAGQITLTEQSIRKILDINERASRTVIDKFNKDAAQLPAELSPGYPLSVPMPPSQNRAGVTSSGVRWSIK